VNYNQESINKRLVTLYGTDITKRPKFRLVWSEDILEHQDGEHHEFDASGKLLRIFKGVKEVPKFMYLGVFERWVLECLSDTPNGTDDYEPIFVFQTKDRQFLPPAWIAIEKFCYAWHNRHNKDVKSQELTEQELREMSEAGIFEELFGNDTNVSDAFREKSAIALPGKDF
jgi:hypothetical protein